MKKHGVKNLGGWGLTTEHLNIFVCEAPSLDALQKLGMEPVMMALSAYESCEEKLASSLEEAAKMLRQAR